MFKIMYLKEQFLEGLSKVESGLIDECKKSNKSNILIPVLAISNIFIMNVLQLLGLINMVALVSSLIKSVKRQKSKYEKFVKLKQEIEDIVAKANSIQIRLSNNETFTLKRLKELRKKREKELKTSPKNRSLVIIANMAIQNYIDNDILPNNLPIEIESTIIRLLQNDLNTNESDMSILLESTKQKASLDALVHRME